MANQKISSMNKVPTLTKAMKIALGELEPGVGNYATDPEQLGLTINPRKTVSTAGATITLDLDGMPKAVFVGSASFATAKVLAVSNPTNAIELTFLYQITDLAGTLDLSSFITNDALVSSGIWTAFDIGRFRLKAFFDGTVWWIDEINGPYA